MCNVQTMQWLTLFELLCTVQLYLTFKFNTFGRNLLDCLEKNTGDFYCIFGN